VCAIPVDVSRKVNRLCQRRVSLQVARRLEDLVDRTGALDWALLAGRYFDNDECAEDYALVACGSDVTRPGQKKGQTL
jgi:hypothetical protein